MCSPGPLRAVWEPVSSVCAPRVCHLPSRPCEGRGQGAERAGGPSTPAQALRGERKGEQHKTVNHTGTLGPFDAASDTTTGKHHKEQHRAHNVTTQHAHARLPCPRRCRGSVGAGCAAVAWRGVGALAHFLPAHSPNAPSHRARCRAARSNSTHSRVYPSAGGCTYAHTHTRSEE